MKFLCPSCKAKYQIADEKVAGRSVRMKCRKCDFMIQVSSSMATPSGVGSEAPAPPEAISAVDVGSSPREEQASSPTAMAPPPPRARSSAVGEPSAPLAAKPAPPSPPARSALGAPPAPPPGARPASNKTTMVGGAGALRAPSSPQAAAGPARPLPATAELAPDEPAEVGLESGALAGAFSAAFGGGGDAAPEAEAPVSMPGDEWFVGINGVPVGPIRLSELRSKAAAGAVDKESLVWRDGFEDWRPLKTYPELVAVVEEGVSSARASLTPFTAPASEVREPGARAGGGVPGPAESESAVSTSGVTGSAVVTEELESLGVPRRRGTSPAVWVAMAVAILFGLTIGFVLFGGQKPTEKIVEKIVEVPAKGAEQGSVPAAAAADNTLPESNVPGDPQAPKRTGGPSKPGSTPEGDGKPGLNGLKGLTGLSGLGPSGGPNSGGPSAARPGGGQLESGQIQATVSRYTGSVKRRCWQPALDARAKDAPMTAKVTVTITVGGSGSVQSATTSGEPRGYSGLASCIAGSVRSWQFPASGGTTVANVPFVFAGQ